MHNGPRTAYIHIGAPKTGTTAIQAAFSNAKDQLREIGYHYLDGDRNHSECLALMFWETPDALKLGRLRWFDEEKEFLRHRDSLLNELSEQIDQSAPLNLIISAEELSGFREQEVHDFISFLRVRFERVCVIAYAREPLSWMTSASQQGAKWSGDTLEKLFRLPRMPNYELRFKYYIRAVGRENFDLRTYDASENEFDIVADFTKAINIDHKFQLSSVSSRMNLAISHRSAILLSAINAIMPPFVEHRYNPCRAFSVVQDCRLPGRKFTLPTETVLEAADSLEKERDWLNETMGKLVFFRPATPEISLDNWYGGEKEELEKFAIVLLENSRHAQNEKALIAFLRSQKHRSANIDLANKLLTNAWMLSTDRWTLHLVASEAVEIGHPDRRLFFAKQRIMNRIEEPEADDSPLAIGNPFDRDL